MRALQPFYPRIRDRIRYEERDERKLILLCVVVQLTKHFSWDEPDPIYILLQCTKEGCRLTV